MNLATLLNAMPGAVAQGMIWGIMAIGLYITYNVLNFSDLTVDGTMATGWVGVGKNWYYMDSNGVMVTGTKVIDGTTYKFDSNGVWIG